jgi:RNA polymerase sigma factor (sigma-70 family)
MKLEFEQLAATHITMIRRIAAAHEADAHLAEELVQEILLALWRALPSFRSEGSPRAFVARIATNLSVTHVRRAMRQGSVGAELSEDLRVEAAGPEHELMALDQRVSLLDAVRALPLAYRQAVMLTLEGLSGEEVANVLGISENAVGVRMWRAKELLRSSMRRQNGED